MKTKSLYLSICAALTLLFLPGTSFAGGGHGGGGGGGGGWHGGGFRGGGFRGGGFRGGRFHGGHFYRYGWWPGFGWGWWGWGGFYPYWVWGDYYPYYAGSSYGGDDPPGSGWQNENQALQAKLAQLGFYHGRIDGVVGPETEAAIREFQASRGLRATGELDSETLDALGSG
jgi:hypothetical protein